MISLRPETPTVSQYKFLARAVGWEERAASFVRTALAHSHYVICAYDGADIIGMGRISGDGETFFYLQDVMVLPAYQKHGVGHALMAGLMGWLESHATSHAIACLRPVAGTEDFYARFGFGHSGQDTTDMSRGFDTAPRS